MREVLYIGPYRQNDEWGYTAKGFASTLARIPDIDLAIRPIWFNGENKASDIEHLEKHERHQLKNKDVLIQHGLPSHLNYNGLFNRNIAITSLDCDISNTSWTINLSLFDEILVFSKHEKSLLINSGIEANKIKYLDFPPLFVNNNTDKIDFSFEGTKFYSVSSMDEKSGLKETLIAYLSSFCIMDDVLLIVMTNDSDAVQKQVESLKESLGIFGDKRNYPHIAVINTTQQGIVNYMHQYCDFYIDIGYNSRVTQNTLKAIYYNSIPILLDTCEQLIPNHYLYVKSYRDIPVYRNKPIRGLYSGEFEWGVPSAKSLSDKMKICYEQDQQDLLDEYKQNVMSVKNKLFKTPTESLMELICTQ